MTCPRWATAPMGCRGRVNRAKKGHSWEEWAGHLLPLSLDVYLALPPCCTIWFLLKPGLLLVSCLELYNLSAHEEHLQGLGNHVT